MAASTRSFENVGHARKRMAARLAAYRGRWNAILHATGAIGAKTVKTGVLAPS